MRENELVGDVNESGGTAQPYLGTDPLPVQLRLLKAPPPDTPHGLIVTHGSSLQERGGWFTCAPGVQPKMWDMVSPSGEGSANLP